MIDNTINDDKAIAGGGEGAILAGRYKAFRRPGEVAWGRQCPTGKWYNVRRHERGKVCCGRMTNGGMHDDEAVSKVD